MTKIRLTGSIVFSQEVLEDSDDITQTERHKRPCCSTTFFFALSKQIAHQIGGNEPIYTNHIYIRHLNIFQRIIRVICCIFGAYWDTKFDKGSLKRIWKAYHEAISSSPMNRPDAVPHRLPHLQRVGQ